MSSLRGGTTAFYLILKKKKNANLTDHGTVEAIPGCNWHQDYFIKGHGFGVCLSNKKQFETALFELFLGCLGFVTDIGQFVCVCRHLALLDQRPHCSVALTPGLWVLRLLRAAHPSSLNAENCSPADILAASKMSISNPGSVKR